MSNNYFNDNNECLPKRINETHQLALFVCDTSGSMGGVPITNLMKAVNNFKKSACEDKKAADVIAVAVLGFNHDTWLVQGWHPVSEMEPVQMRASGGTDISKALNTAVQMVRERCLYPSYAGNLYKPVIVLITDGYGGDVSEVAKLIQRRIEEKKLQLWILCAKDYDKETVAKLCQKGKDGKPRFVFELEDKNGYDFSQFFNILSKTLVEVSHRAPGEENNIRVTRDEVDNLKVPDLNAWLNDD